MLYKSYYPETDEIIDTIRKKSIVSARINHYALEEVVLGKIKPTEKIPFDRYIRETDLTCENPYEIRGELLAGMVVDSDEKIVDREPDFFGDLFYTFRVKCTFIHEIYGDRFKSTNTISEYLRNLYPLFREVMNTQIAYKDTASKEEFLYAPTQYDIAHFLASIKIKNIRKNASIGSYLKNVKYLPHFVQMLVEKKGERYILVNNDTESYVYKLALLCSLFFSKVSHAALFETKAIEWVRQNIK